MSVSILAFAASNRAGSFNKLLIKQAALAAEQLGARVTLLDLNDYKLPLYDGDLEATEGLPKAAEDLLALLAQHDALLISTPEYNGFFPPLLKNTLDWMSRPKANGDSGLVDFKGKTAALLAASPGPMAGVRTLIPTRQYLSNLGLLVIPAQFGLGSASKAFNDQGELLEERQINGMKAVVAQLIDVASRK